MGDFKKMKKAYGASKSIIQNKMQKERKEDFKTIGQILVNAMVERKKKL
jgi:hypothetical protein